MAIKDGQPREHLEGVFKSHYQFRGTVCGEIIITVTLLSWLWFMGITQ